MKHARKCPERLARECAAPIECEHGFDVCPTCDPCTCINDRAASAAPMESVAHRLRPPADIRHPLSVL
jgi:hypothetical protein